MNQQVITTKSAEETRQFAFDFARSILAGKNDYARKDTPCIILLYGNLGVGKTTFMQGFAKGLGIESRIISPTFIIVRKYNIAEQNNESYSSREQSESRSLKTDNSRLTAFARTIKSLYHIDLYRTESDADLEGLGMNEILEEKNAIVAIEWPEKLRSFLPEKRIEIRFTTLSENEREIIVNAI